MNEYIVGAAGVGALLTWLQVMVQNQARENKRLLDHVLLGNGDPQDKRPNLTRIENRLIALEEKLPCLDDAGCPIEVFPRRDE